MCVFKIGFLCRTHNCINIYAYPTLSCISLYFFRASTLAISNLFSAYSDNVSSTSSSTILTLRYLVQRASSSNSNRLGSAPCLINEYLIGLLLRSFGFLILSWFAFGISFLFSLLVSLLLS